MSVVQIVELLPNHPLVAQIPAFRVEARLTSEPLPASARTQGQWSDEHDSHASHHVAMTASGELVAAARLCVHESLDRAPHREIFADLQIDVRVPVGVFSRLVVHPGFRDQGIARRLDESRFRRARELGCATCVGVVSDRVLSDRVHSLDAHGFRLVARGSRHVDLGGWLSGSGAVFVAELDAS